VEEQQLETSKPPLAIQLLCKWCGMVFFTRSEYLPPDPYQNPHGESYVGWRRIPSPECRAKGAHYPWDNWFPELPNCCSVPCDVRFRFVRTKDTCADSRQVEERLANTGGVDVKDLDTIFTHWHRVVDPLMVGFDNIFDHVQNIASRASSYPPYDISRDIEGNTCISIALAGFQKNELKVYVDGGILHVSYDKVDPTTGDILSTKVLHQGIARRSFDLQFRLSDKVEVYSAAMSDGMLTIQLKQVDPEVNQKTIEIQ
jgi:molecular chaperone IbpA